MGHISDRTRMLLPLVLLGIATGCGSGQTPDNPQSGVQLPSGIQLDPALSHSESEKLAQDINTLGSLPLEGSKIKYFNDIFGGSTSPDVMRYLTERVHWILSSNTDVDSLLNSMQAPQGLSESGLDSSDSTPQIVALNIGTAIWFTSLSDHSAPATLKLGGSSIQVSSPRTGIIQLGNGYTQDDDMTVLRLSTLVHEARHSDCTGGAYSSDLDRFHAGQQPAHLECGHMHVTCPAGHPYAGYPACDHDSWGAYSVETDYLAAVAKACPGCNNTDRKVALALFSDAASRVLNLDDELSGALGTPDMSSTDAINP